MWYGLKTPSDKMMNINFQNAAFEYEPYPIAYIPNFLDADTYAELARTYPEKELFDYSENVGAKYTLSETTNKQNLHRFLAETPCWNAFYSQIKSREFVQGVIDFLNNNQIDLGIRKFVYQPSLGYRRRGPIRRSLNTTVLRSRFEFSSMSADGGNVVAHTDGPLKIITLVISFITAGEWDTPNYGGGTSVVVPKDKTQIYNHLNKFKPLDEVDFVKTFDFVPNQCVFFIKTYNSWHAVASMTGPSTALRKTLIVNIDNIP